MTRQIASALAMLFAEAVFLSGCTPSVKVEAPDKPIEINMNVKIEHEIRLKVEKDVEDLIATRKGLF
jgi:predicted component of type VI protein secretion system